MMVFIFLIIICFILLVYWRDKVYSNAPLCDKYWPIVGHIHWLIGDSKKLIRSVKTLCEETNKKGGVAILKVPFSEHYLITDPEDNFRLANGTLRKHFAYKFARNWLGDGLVTSSGETWKRHRKLLNPAFSQQMLNSFIGIFNNESKNLVINVEREMKRGPVDVTNLFRQMSLKTLFLTAFGMEVEDSDFNEKYIQAVDELLSLIVRRFQNILLHFPFIYKISGLKKKEKQIIEKIIVMANKVINSKREVLKTASEAGNSYTDQKDKSILDLLLKGLGDDALTDKEIRDEVDTSIVAGYDTTSRALTVTLLVLGSYPEVQEKLYNEIMSVLEDPEEDVNKFHYPKLVYCEAVLKETLRLYPIAPVVLRRTETAIQLKNCTVPAGTNCFLGVYGVNRHPVWGPDAETFRPERWLEPGGVPEDANTFASFSVGRRTCIGKTYAVMAMKTALVHLMRRYKVKADISKVEFRLDVLMTPVDNCDVEFELRVK